MFIIYDTLGVYGGSTTLILRICTWLVENGYGVAIISDSVSNKEIVSKVQNLRIPIYVCKRNEWTKISKVIKKYDGENIKIISFIWDYYLDLECIKKIYRLSFDNFIYCIHPETFVKGDSTKLKFFASQVKKSYARLFTKMSRNNSIIMMDLIDIDVTEKALNTKFSNAPAIINLPIKCVERNDCEELIAHGYESGLIMTAARADYPFKGYVFGLIKDFCDIKRNHPSLLLEIITGGDDIEQLYECINKLDSSIRKDIIVKGWMEYEKLLCEIEKCYLFIGMGTSVLESALRYKPSIVVKYNTYDNIADSTIRMRPEFTTTGDSCEVEAKKLLNKLLDLSYDEYREEALNSFKAVKGIYDIEVCMKRMVNLKNADSNCLMDRFEILKHYIHLKIKQIREKNKKYDYEKLAFDNSDENNDKKG